MSELGIKDLSEGNYALFQNPKIAKHYKKGEIVSYYPSFTK